MRTCTGARGLCTLAVDARCSATAGQPATARAGARALEPLRLRRPLGAPRDAPQPPRERAEEAERQRQDERRRAGPEPARHVALALALEQRAVGHERPLAAGGRRDGADRDRGIGRQPDRRAEHDAAALESQRRPSSRRPAGPAAWCASRRRARARAGRRPARRPATRSPGARRRRGPRRRGSSRTATSPLPGSPAGGHGHRGAQRRRRGLVQPVREDEHERDRRAARHEAGDRRAAAASRAAPRP